MKRLSGFLIALLLATEAPPALAWGQAGHRVTGAIAEQHLNRQTRRAIRRILGRETLAEASTWPDFMRSSPDPFWEGTAGPFHYVTVPTGKRYAEVGAPPEGDAVTALARFSATVRDRRAPLADRQLALRFIVHIIGDLHQPLHAGNGTDRGGNDVRVTFFGDATNLHSVWDSGIIDRQQLSYTELTGWLTARTTRQQAKLWRDPDPMVWIAESTAIRDRIYPADPKLSSDYVFQHRAVVEERLSMAGIRMAAYLNDLFD